MADSHKHRSRNKPQVYTSFDQFIAQNDFSQLNNNNNQYISSGGASTSSAAQAQYYSMPSATQYYNPGAYNNYTLTAEASEFVPRAPDHLNGQQHYSHSYYDNYYNPVTTSTTTANVVDPATLVNLTLAEQTPSSNSTSTGAIPKKQQQQSNRNGHQRNQPQEKLPNTNSRRQPAQQQGPKNPKSNSRRRNDHPTNEPREDENYSQWDDTNGHHNNHNGHHNGPGRSGKHTSGGDHRNHRCQAQPRQPQHNGEASSSSFRNNGNTRGGDDRQPADIKRKPTDYQPNRNLKRPERVLDLPVDISQREKQIVEIDAGHLECLVCCEKIRPSHSTWNCKNCYSILHLNCTNKWATRSKTDEGWRCPACQNLTAEIPQDYFCFCGKQKNPQYNRNDVAHSCGEVCHRRSTCDHPCTLLCHPGACPTCQASVTRECGCGTTTKTLICSQEETITCDGLCGKLRNCGLHSCGQKCHTGACADCEETLEHNCHCGTAQRTVPCTAENLQTMKFGCDSACEKDLNCQNHKCQEKCHAGDCGDCDLTPDRIRSCPCGKKPILASERSSCLDEIPLCESPCNKILSCGVPSNPHRCIGKCHLGVCPPCQKSTAVKCRCGQMDQMVKCKQLTTRADDARCKKKCTKKRSCGKHKCNVECCIDIDHICPLPCPSTLSCGKHKCERTCHPGHCLPCQRASFHELQCECGAQVLYPPVPCGTKKPVCDKPCTRAHVCAHAVLHNCHTGPVCPPCMIQTAKWCFGSHEQRRTIPCSQESFSCGMPCNKELSCGEHKCIKKCHEGDCMAQSEVCKQSCSKARTMCGHKCMAPCHMGECPETMCKESVEVVCQCGNIKQKRACHDFANDFKRIATAQLASSLQDMQSGGGSGLKEIFGPIKWTTAKKLECDDNCAILERNRRMAIGLQIKNPDLSSRLQTKYSDYLKNWLKEDPRFIEMLHDKLTELVKLAKESKQKSRSHSFPVMNREKRHAVHDMCEMFGVESVAYDAEPQRNIVATAYKDRCWLPAQSIMLVVKRESGGVLRKVPGPAWGMRRT